MELSKRDESKDIEQEMIDLVDGTDGLFNENGNLDIQITIAESFRNKFKVLALINLKYYEDSPGLDTIMTNIFTAERQKDEERMRSHFSEFKDFICKLRDKYSDSVSKI